MSYSTELTQISPTCNMEDHLTADLSSGRWGQNFDVRVIIMFYGLFCVLYHFCSMRSCSYMSFSHSQKWNVTLILALVILVLLLLHTVLVTHMGTYAEELMKQSWKSIRKQSFWFLLLKRNTYQIHQATKATVIPLGDPAPFQNNWL